MSVSLTKHYLFDLNPVSDLVVVLRRYDEGTHPWGVHRLTLDADSDRFITSRPIGLLTDDAVMQVAARNQLGVYWLEAVEPFNPVALQVHTLIHRYIWTQVVPMEWHDKADEMGARVMLLAAPDACEWELYLAEFEDRGVDPHWQLREFVEGRWDIQAWLASQRPAVA